MTLIFLDWSLENHCDLIFRLPPNISTQGGVLDVSSGLSGKEMYTEMYTACGQCR